MGKRTRLFKKLGPVKFGVSEKGEYRAKVSMRFGRKEKPAEFRRFQPKDFNNKPKQIRKSKKRKSVKYGW